MSELRWQDAVHDLGQRITREYGFQVLVCGEIECVIPAVAHWPDPDIFWSDVMERSTRAGIAVASIAHEEHPDHYEFRLSPTDPLSAAWAITHLRQMVMACADMHGLFCSFEAGSAAPYSGLHWHLHLANEQGINVFLKQEEQMSPPLSHVLGGLLASMRDLMLCFAPTESSYARITSGADHIPQVVSWGGNNRSVSLRLPESVVPLRHIEHRVCGADADAFASVWAILVGVHLGLSGEHVPGAQMYGRAEDMQYDLPRLPASWEEAHSIWQASETVAHYMALTALDA